MAKLFHSAVRKLIFIRILFTGKFRDKKNLQAFKNIEGFYLYEVFEKVELQFSILKTHTSNC